MRTIKNLPVPQDGNDAKFPDGQIRNESTDGTITGTPVVREIYGDVLTNIYRLLRYAGITPTQTEDGADTQYQMVDALKVFSNTLNDLMQVCSVSGLGVSVGINFDSLPENYVFFGKLSDAMLASQTYTLSSSKVGAIKSYNLKSTSDIVASKYVMVVINSVESKVIPFESTSSSVGLIDIINTSLGSPLGFNESSKMLYFSNGRILSNTPESFDIQQNIIDSEANVNLEVLECIFHKGKLICLVLDTVTSENSLFCLSGADFSNVEGQIAVSINTGANRNPYMYCDGTYVYFSNSSAEINDSANDYNFIAYLFDAGALTLSLSSFFSLANSFQKTTNLIMNGGLGKAHTLISGTLNEFLFSGDPLTQVGFFNSIDGVLFKFNSNTYYSNGEIGTKWNY